MPPAFVFTFFYEAATPTTTEIPHSLPALADSQTEQKERKISIHIAWCWMRQGIFFLVLWNNLTHWQIIDEITDSKSKLELQKWLSLPNQKHLPSDASTGWQIERHRRWREVSPFALQSFPQNDQHCLQNLQIDFENQSFMIHKMSAL